MLFDSSEQLIDHVVAQTDTALLSFSCGKDSIGCYLALRDRIPNLIPFYLYNVPNLEFVNRSLGYFEGAMGRRIIRLPHPSLYRQLNQLVFQAPENCAIVEDARLPEFDYLDVYRVIREDNHLAPDTPVAIGVRAVDSPQRWAAMKTHGPLSESRHTFFPIFDWRADRLRDTIRESGIKLPVDYKWFGRSFDGLDYRFLSKIKTHAPADFERILAYFPLAELELKRMEYRERYYADRS